MTGESVRIYYYPQALQDAVVVTVQSPSKIIREDINERSYVCGSCGFPVLDSQLIQHTADHANRLGTPPPERRLV